MKVEFTATRSDSKAASYAIDKFQPKLSGVAAFNFFGSMLWGFLITIGSIVVLKGIPSVFHNHSGFIFGLSALLIGVGIFIFQRYFAKRMAQNRAGVYGSTVTYELLSDKIISWKNDNIKIEIMPEAIIEVAEYRGFILIFVGKTQAFYIPLSAFKTNKEKDEFIAILNGIAKQSC